MISRSFFIISKNENISIEHYYVTKNTFTDEKQSTVYTVLENFGIFLRRFVLCRWKINSDVKISILP